MNTPGFTADLSIRELRSFRGISAAARPNTFIEPQQIRGDIFRPPFARLELRCGRTDSEGNPCIDGKVDACQVWRCVQSIFGGESCELLGKVNYPGSFQAGCGWCMYGCINF
jgi:hypothetical protein